jgi:hypothetical protein
MELMRSVERVLVVGEVNKRPKHLPWSVTACTSTEATSCRPKSANGIQQDEALEYCRHENRVCTATEHEMHPSLDTVQVRR